MKKGIDELKKDFILNEIFNNCILAAFRTRNSKCPIYKKNLNNEELQFVVNLKADLKDKLENWENSRDETDHCNKLLDLTKNISGKYGHILHEGKFRFGVAQKLVNLYLKYLWVIGRGELPIHCPVDGVVKTKLVKSLNIKDSELTNWTEISDISQYIKYINSIKEIISNETSSYYSNSIAEWELRAWNEEINLM